MDLGRGITRILLVLVVAAWGAAALIYVSSKRMIDRHHVPEARNVPTASNGRHAEGERLARVFGCLDCHGDRLQGGLVFEHALDGQLVAPNLTRSAARLTIPEIEAIVRQGIHTNGTSVFGMPASSFAVMTDEDLGAVLAYVRSQPQQVENWGEQDFGLYSRYRMVRGFLPAEADITVYRPWRSFLLKDERRWGEYLALTACSQCHGLDLEGKPGAAPSLDRVYDYDRFEFVTLMREGLAPGGGELGVMTETALKRFQHLDEDEVQALYDFLKTRP